MYQIVIIPKTENPNVPSISLSYKGNERAMKALGSLHDDLANEANAVISIADDYGYMSKIRRFDILHVLYIDCEQAEVQRLEKNLCLARTSKKLFARVKADPEESALISAIMPVPDHSAGAAVNRASSIIQ